MRERKFATLLFADIVGFTSIGEAYDPELVASLVSEIFEQLAQEVRHHEGTVEKFAGDAILAVFGVPATHEDDPERAVRAAFEMQAAMAALPVVDSHQRLRLRIGIESGEVLAALGRLNTIVACIGCLTIAAAGLVAFLLASKFSQPIAALVAGTDILDGVGSTQFLRNDEDATFSASTLSFGTDARVRLDAPIDPIAPALTFVQKDGLRVNAIERRMSVSGLVGCGGRCGQ